MDKKNIIRYVLITFLCLVIFSALSIFLVNHYNNRRSMDDIIRNTRLVRNSLQDADDIDIGSLRKDLDELRISIIDLNGKVVFDSQGDYENMNNHLDREEIAAAIEGNSKVVTRYSKTTQKNMMYYAEKFSAQSQTYVARVAIEVTHINDFILVTTITTVLLTLIVVVVLTFIANHSAKKTVIPILKLAEKSRREFFANASHELKTPLTSIKGFAELSQIVEDDEKRRQYNQKIVEESDRMLGLIEDMLNLSKLEEPAKINELSDVDVSAIAEKCIQNLSPQAAKYNVDLNKDIRKLVLKGTVEDYTQLLTNLIDNAIKYNKENGKVIVTIRENFIQVQDSGIGIPVKHQERVFERFYRVDKGRSRKTGGTGLGLSIVKHIAQKYNAEIVLKSSGNGTDIKIIFR